MKVQDTARLVPAASGKIQRAALIRYQSDDKTAIREATALADAGFCVDLIMLRQTNASVSSVDDRINVVLAPITKRRGSPVRYLWEFTAWFGFCTFWLARQTIKRRYAYVQVDSLPDHQVFCALVPKLFGAKVGLFLKEPTKELCLTMTHSKPVALLAGWVAKQSIAFADLCFCVTEPHRQSYVDQGVDPERLNVVLNANQPFPTRSRLRSPEDDRFIVMCHGTIEERYGHKTIVEAAALALEQIPNLSVHLPGKGTYSDEIEHLIKSRQLEDVVTLDGWLSETELAQLLADADIGVVAQLANPYSHLVHTGKMYDYMLAGVPVTASRLRATESLFPDEVTYFEAGNATDLARTWVELSNDRQRGRDQVNASRKRLKSLGWEIQMERMVEAVGLTLA